MRNMRALTVRPGAPEGPRLEQQPVPTPAAGEVLVQLLELGLDGTDKEVVAGEGEPPHGRERLIMGHESLGRVAAVGPGVQVFEEGDLVTATVRRPCGTSCGICAAGQYDMCPQGVYIERGILAADGFGADYYLEQPEHLVRVPEGLRHVAVLTEPMSIGLKAIERAFHFQSDFPWSAERTLVTGGSLSLLTALLLRQRGLAVTFLARSAPDSTKAQLVEAMGGRYVQGDERPLEETLGGAQFDFIFEGAGVPQLIFQSARCLAANGVLCVAGLPAGGKQLAIPAADLAREMVLENRVIFGSVNSNRGHFERVLALMPEIEHRYPGLLERIITGRHKAEDFRQALDDVDVKNILVFSGD